MPQYQSLDSRERGKLRLVIEFPNEEKAAGVREMLLAMQKEYLIELGDAVVAVKDANGRVKLNESHKVEKATAAVNSLLSADGIRFM